MFRMLCLLLGVTLLLGLPVAAQDGYRFTLDGEEFVPSHWPVRGEGEHLEPGDLIRFRRTSLVLGPPGDYAFETRQKGLYLSIDRGDARLVTVRVEDDSNPLKALSPKELQHLRGVELRSWSPEIAKQLEAIDWEQCCLRIDGLELKNRQPREALPALPLQLRYLEIEESTNQGYRNLSGLKNLRQLEYFGGSLMTLGALDAGLISDLPRLRSVRVERLANPERLGQPALAFLAATLDENTTDVDWVQALPGLRILELRQSPGLRSLAGLSAHPGLRAVDAGICQVTELPSGPIPQLKLLSVLGGTVGDEAVAALKEANPELTVRHDWAEELRRGLQQCDLVKVRSGGLCHRSPESEELLFEVRGADAVEQLVAGLQIVGQSSGGHCMCCGDPTLEVYRGDQLVASLGFHHGRSLRWEDGWPGDGVLTDAGADFLVDWLAEHGVEGPQEELRSTRARTQQNRQRWEAVTGHLSQQTQDALIAVVQNPSGGSPLEQVWQAMENQFDTREDQVDALLAMLSGPSEADEIFWYEQMAFLALNEVPAELVSRRVEAFRASSDSQKVRAAERYRQLQDLSAE